MRAADRGWTPAATVWPGRASKKVHWSWRLVQHWSPHSEPEEGCRGEKGHQDRTGVSQAFGWEDGNRDRPFLGHLMA